MCTPCIEAVKYAVLSGFQLTDPFELPSYKTLSAQELARPSWSRREIRNPMRGKLGASISDSLGGRSLVMWGKHLDSYPPRTDVDPPKLDDGIARQHERGFSNCDFCDLCGEAIKHLPSSFDY